MKPKTGRRFWLVVLCVIANIVLVSVGILDGGAFVALQSMAVGAYLAANGHQEHTEHKFNADQRTRHPS